MRNRLLFFLFAIAPFATVPVIYNGSLVPKLAVSGLIMTVSICWQLHELIFKNKVTSSSYHLPCMLIASWFFISTAIGSNKALGFRYTAMVAFHIAYLFSFLQAGLSKEKLLHLFTAQALILSIITIIQSALGRAATATMGNPNWNASFLLILLPLCLERFKRGGKILPMISSALILIAVLLTGSRASLASCLTILLICTWQYRKAISKYSNIYITIIFALVLFIGAALSIPRIRSLSLQESSIVYRKMLWKICLLNTWDNPLFGTGPGSFSKTATGRQLDLSGETLNFITLRTGITHAHNEYLEILSEAGIPGLILFVYLIFAVLKNIKSSPAMACIGGILVSSIAGFPLHLPVHALYVLTIIGLYSEKKAFTSFRMIRYKKTIFSLGLLIFGLIFWKNFLNPVLSESFFSAAENALFKGNTKAASKLYTLSMQSDPLNDRAINGKALIYHQADRYSESSKLLSKVIKFRPSRDAYYLLGMNSHFQGKENLAYTYLKLAASLENKRDNEARIAFIKLALGKHRMADAWQFISELERLFCTEKDFLILKDYYWKLLNEKGKE